MNRFFFFYLVFLSTISKFIITIPVYPPLFPYELFLHYLHYVAPTLFNITYQRTEGDFPYLHCVWDTSTSEFIVPSWIMTCSGKPKKNEKTLSRTAARNKIRLPSPLFASCYIVQHIAALKGSFLFKDLLPFTIRPASSKTSTNAARPPPAFPAAPNAPPHRPTQSPPLPYSYTPSFASLPPPRGSDTHPNPAHLQ